MTTWLTLHYSISVVILLSAAALFLYWGLQRSLHRQNVDFADQKVQILVQLLQKRPLDRAALEQEVLEEAGISTHSHAPFYLRVVDEQKRVLVETPGMGSILPASVFPQADTSSREASFSSPASHRSFLVTSVQVPGAAAGPGRQYIQAALDVTDDAGVLQEYRRAIALTIVIGSIVAAAVASRITKRGLRPIADIAGVAGRIGAQHLQDRIGTGQWPRELVGLAVAFDRMLDRLQEAFDRLSRFSADLAHELRNPINNLVGEAQVALSRDRSPEEYQRVLQSGLEEHGRLARMIESMLFLAQADQARSALKVTQVDARSELMAVAEFYQPLADERGIQVLCEGDGRIAADPSLLRRALSNLLSNALKYTPDGGRIVLCVGKSGQDAVTLSVADNGIGIAAAHLPKLGDRFYRVDAARTESPSGAGLGLAIVRSIMALHDGSLQIQSAPGQGTTAILIFPLSAARMVS